MQLVQIDSVQKALVSPSLLTSREATTLGAYKSLTFVHAITFIHLLGFLFDNTTASSGTLHFCMYVVEKEATDVPKIGNQQRS